MMKEADFSAQIRKDLKKTFGPNVFVVLHMDAPRSGRKPYDAYFILDGKHFAMEFKKCDVDAFNIEKVTNNQIVSLEQLDRAGGQAWIVICFVKHNAAFAIDITIWTELKEEFEAKELKSVTYEALCNIEKDTSFAPWFKILYRLKRDNKLTWEVEKLVI